MPLMNKTTEKEADGGQMSLIGHLTELRNRLGIALLAFLVLLVLFISPMPGCGVSNSIANHVFILAPLAEIMEKGRRPDFYCAA